PSARPSFTTPTLHNTLYHIDINRRTMAPKTRQPVRHYKRPHHTTHIQSNTRSLPSTPLPKPRYLSFSARLARSPSLLRLISNTQKAQNKGGCRLGKSTPTT
ncbi:unnamed protein product, partial [Ectocarpus sp. 6 AP-2014]